MIDDIITYLEQNPKAGISIINNMDKKRVLSFSTLIDLKDKGFDGLKDYLNSIKSKGYESITLFLKLKNGSSTAYVTKNKQRVKVVLGRTNNTNLEVSPSVVNAPICDSIGATTPINNDKNMNGLNGIPTQTLDLYSDARRTNEIIPKYEELKKELKEKNEQLQEQRFKIMTLEAQPKTMVSDKVGNMIIPLFMKGLEVIGTKGALNGAQQPQKIENNLTQHQNLLIERIKAGNYDDSYCMLFVDLIEKGDNDNNLFPQIAKLVQTT